MILGGPGVVVNVDETMVSFKAKSHRGRSAGEQIWALVIVDTSYKPSKGFCCVVENRKAETLLPIIRSVVRPGSIIHTDQWAAYNELGRNNDYTHHTVCHKLNFVEPITGVHTQHVESFNNKIKRSIKERCGIVRGKHDDFFLEFLWFENNSEFTFERLIKLLEI